MWLLVSLKWRKALKISIDNCLLFLTTLQLPYMLKVYLKIALNEKCVVSHHSSLSYLSLDIFRPFVGFKGLRLIPRETRDGKKVHFAFADFENVNQTTLVINTLQGYRFHKDDLIGLQFSYAVAH